MAPSAYWGADPIWDSKTLNHNPMMDETRARLVHTTRRPNPNPDFCKQGSDHPSAKVFPIAESGRHLSIYDPATGKFALISTCFPTHHLAFAEDSNHTLWTSAGVGGPGVIGWLNRKMYEETGDEVKSQGWSPFVVDTNGNGKRDAYIELDQPADRSKDTRVAVNTYAVAVSPADGAVWGTVLGYRGYIVRLAPGSNPTETALTEIYEPPSPGFGPRGGDVDRNGVYWVSLASGHLASFDRRKCKILRGPTATGAHCPEGWTFHQLPGPQLRDVQDPGSAEASYYTWVDWFDTFGLGRNVPIRDGKSEQLDTCPGGRKVHQHHSPLSHGLLREERRRTRRRSERRLERARRCGPRMGPGRCITSRAARKTGRRPSRSSFGRIRSAVSLRADCTLFSIAGGAFLRQESRTPRAGGAAVQTYRNGAKALGFSARTTLTPPGRSVLMKACEEK
jgi:hypothetical protein